MKKFTISLRAWHPTFPAEVIVSKIGLPATHAHSVGRPRVTPKGTPLEGTYRDTYCSFNVMEKTEGHFTDGIAKCAQTLRSLATTLGELKETGGRVELYIWIYPEEETNLGFELNVEGSALLSELNLDLAVEIYV